MKQKELTVTELTRKGGQSKYKKYGKKAYSDMGKAGGKKLLEERGSEYFREIRRKGVEKQQKAKEEKEKPMNKLTNALLGEE